MLFIALKCHFLYKFTHTLHSQQSNTCHAAPHLTGEGRITHREWETGAGKLGHLNLGALPCYVSGVQKSHTPTKGLRTKFLVFVLLFMRAIADHKTGRNELKHTSSSVTSTETSSYTDLTCFLLCNTCKSFAKELKKIPFGV